MQLRSEKRRCLWAEIAQSVDEAKPGSPRPGGVPTEGDGLSQEVVCQGKAC